MDPSKVGNLIKELRKNNNLTQKDLADKYGVTYQAVSKWENGTNLPDISLIKEICNDYNLDINKFLDGNKTKKKFNKKNYIVIGLIILIFILLVMHFYNDHKKQSFDFKTITSTCDIFKVTGSLAYDNAKSSIYISNITYCGGDDEKIYDDITCNLYEYNDLIFTCDKKEKINLEEFLHELSIKIDNYQQKCSIYKEDTLKLKIEANKNGVKTVYEIPLKTDKC